MCANPEMMRTLAAEIREEMVNRKAARQAGTGRRWRVAACAAAACIALIVIL